MANLNEMGPNPATERDTAPVPLTSVQMEVERIGDLTSGLTYEFPRVRGGICEFCGVLDPNQPSQYQYKLCGHYRGKTLACSYCPRTKDIDEVVNHSVLRIIQHPDKPRKLIVCCDSYECRKAHEERWQLTS